jgi:DnaJ-class molecular chaperone
MTTEEQELCPACGGSGQLNSFKDESRFLLTVEECSLCCGTGVIPAVAEQKTAQQNHVQQIQNKETE